MENRNIIDELTRYRVKVERDGKPVMDVPGILCLPGLLAAPRLGIAGMVAAPLLGYSVHLENRDGKPVDLEEAIRKTAETISETAADTAEKIKEAMDKAWQETSVDDTESGEDKKDQEEEDSPAGAAESNEEIVEDLEKQEEDDIPTIEVKPDDDSDRE